MLTAKATDQAKPKEKPYRLSDEKGLYLEVHPNGSKYWRLKYRFAGKEKRLAFGVYPEVSLKRARGKRADAREMLADGIDPSEARRTAKLKQKKLAVDSFGAIAEDWLQKRKTTWSPGHVVRVTRIVKKDLAALGSRPITNITPPEILSELRKIEARGAVETAHRAMQIASQVFRYAVANGNVESDPARDLRAALTTPIATHRAAITDPKHVGELLRAMDGYKGTPVVRAALKLAPLLFVRPGELRNMEWAELDLEKASWIIPGKKMKMGKDHIVPLSQQAVAVLRELEPLTGTFRYVLPSARSPRRPMSDNAVLAAFRRMGIAKEDMSGHGFRAMARTILDEVLGFRVDIIEHQLAHSVKDPNGQAYNRTKFLEQRVEMMQKWADYLGALKAEK